jgi:hypothetical protein
MTAKPFIPYRDLESAERAEYCKNVREVAQSTFETNQKEIEAIKLELEELQQENFEYMCLPIMAHTFILLVPKQRFDLLPMYIDLLLKLQRRTPERCDILVKAIEYANFVQRDDTLDNYPVSVPFDTSQFLTQYHATRMHYSLTISRAELKLQKKIREYIVKHYKQALVDKQRTLATCNEILSKKLLGE